MNINLEGDASIEPFKADEKGRITLGKEYANNRVRVAVLERIGENSSVIPDEFPRFDYRSVGVAPTASVATRRAALAENGSPGDPYWVGTTAADDVEVGITPEEYKRHILITGTADSDRQAAIRAQYQQALDHGRGVLVYDAYSHNDTEGGASPYRTIAREVGREDDVIEINVDDPGSASFNATELRQETLANPESHQAAEEIEATVDLLEHFAYPTNIGREGYWGPKTARVVRSIIQSAAKEGVSPTILDICDVLASSSNRPDDETLSEDRREWLTEARTMIGENTEQAEREPAVRRLESWINASAVRRAIADPDPSFSVEQAVREGKIVLITGESQMGLERTQVAVAASLRAWSAQQEAQDRREGETAPFTLFAAGYHKLANTHLKLVTLLSLSRAYEFAIVGSAPGIQSFDNSDVIGDHAATHLTFAVSEREARKAVQYHTQNVTQQSLQRLSSNVAYLRHPSQKVESIKINTLLPTVGTP